MDEQQKLERELAIVSSIVAALTACLEQYATALSDPDVLDRMDANMAEAFLTYLTEHEAEEVVNVLFGLYFGTLVSYTAALDIDPFMYLQALGQVAALTQSHVETQKDQ